MTFTFRRPQQGSQPRHRATRYRDEASNSFALFLIMMPVIMGAFGIGLDMSRNVYIRTTLQNGLDMATVSGAGVTDVNQEGVVDIDEEGALRAVETVYAQNRPGFMECTGDNSRIGDTGYHRCWKQWGSPTINRAYLQYGVRERSKNAFLPVIGVKWQDYHIRSQARINQQAE
jgi:hypothetical protein